MNNILNVIRAIGRDIKDLRTNSLKTDKAYELFPTYTTLQAQMTTNIRDKHVELGLDSLIDEKLKNGGDPFVTTSKLPTIDTSKLASKNDLEELKRSVGSGSGGVRRAPMMYTLDRTTNPWTIWFDNGCGLQLPDYSANSSAYGYGFSPNINNTTWVNSPIVGNIISASRGTLTLDSVINTVNAYYWNDSTKVINPIKDASSIDMNEYFINQTDPYKIKHKNVIRVMYELGVWTLADIQQFSNHLDNL